MAIVVITVLPYGPPALFIAYIDIAWCHYILMACSSFECSRIKLILPDFYTMLQRTHTFIKFDLIKQGMNEDRLIRFLRLTVKVYIEAGLCHIKNRELIQFFGDKKDLNKIINCFGLY